MPFLKPQKTPRSRILEESTKKNGFRRTVFAPSGKRQYIGEWKNNLHAGKGIERHRSFIYEGDWKNGMKHGYGILSHENEIGVRTLVYEGEWRYNKKEGEGSYYLSENEIYQGAFKNGLRHGYGKMWYADGAFYIGDWQNDARSGQGLYFYANGDIFEGNWKHDKKFKEGRHYFINVGGTTLTGIWMNDSPVLGMMEIGAHRQMALEPMPIAIKPSELVGLEDDYAEAANKALRKSSQSLSMTSHERFPSGISARSKSDQIKRVSDPPRHSFISMKCSSE